MMRKYFLLLTMIVIAFPYQVLYADGLNPNETVNKYFNAKITGNVDIIKSLITGPLYQSQKALLEQNKTYPNFLKNYYAGARITIEDSVLGYLDILRNNHPTLYQRYQRFKSIGANQFSMAAHDQIAIVLTNCQLSNGNSFNTKLLLKYDSSHNWKIYDEVLVH